jgi:hypothetical protein
MVAGWCEGRTGDFRWSAVGPFGRLEIKEEVSRRRDDPVICNAADLRSGLLTCPWVSSRNLRSMLSLLGRGS